MIEYFRDYYEDVEKHFISGTFYPPVVSSIVWDGGIGIAYDPRNGKKIEIKIYKDRYSEEKYYNIIFLCEGKKYTQFSYDGKRIVDFSDAKLYAAYKLEMHLNGKMTIDFK